MNYQQWKKRNFASLMWYFHRTDQPYGTWDMFCRDQYMAHCLKQGDMVYDKIKRFPVVKRFENGER